MKKRKNNTKLISGVVIFIIAVLAFAGSRLIKEPETLFEDTGLRNYQQSESNMMYVDFIDVGQGNCTLVHMDDTAILVDSGEVGAAQTVISYIKNLGIDELDCVLVTHPHSDHMGAMTKILYEFEIKDLIMPEIPEDIIPTNSTYEKFLTAVSDNAENVIPAEAGMTYSYGEMNLEILAPLHGYDNLNDMSAVSRVSFGETSVMFMGDASTAVENDLLKTGKDFSADIINIGHHGSKTASSQKWLEAVNPGFAVICCGAGNEYGHPHSVVTERLDNIGIEYYRTDLNGTVVFQSNSKEFTKLD
ncbi:MAG: ComEC/Rec2 family competence protein [Clostridiaceae bacterium]|nr:ComEC/Rec2 family competence protein [Clostridiaceae bacterium]